MTKSIASYQNDISEVLLSHKNTSLDPAGCLLKELSARIADLVNSEAAEKWTVHIGWAGSSKAGITKYHPKQPTILFSKEFLVNATFQEATELIYHEIAHVFAGEDAGHGPAWMEQCCRLGIMDNVYVNRVRDLDKKETS